VVGNQAEYKFALSENIASAPVLKLKVQIFPSQIRKKRKRNVDDSLNVTLNLDQIYALVFGKRVTFRLSSTFLLRFLK
jgi:hypothetical protein